ncbi:MAG: HipA family kinase, partial [Longimicrobiales bacterium]
GRILGLNVPELVFVQVDDALGRNEPDPEIRALLRASVGLNLALDYLPGSIMFDAAAGDAADAELASRAVWFDAFITNVDRTAYNPNLLYWHKSLYFIDHGAALYFHHDWPTLERVATTPFAQIKTHVLLPWAERIVDADQGLRLLLTEAVLAGLVALVPDSWLESTAHERSPAAMRNEYLEYFLRRLNAAPNFVQEAVRARAQLV